ncbi:MAG: hypothetical protein ABF990_12025 [Acetobacter sp.]|uniref:hypothetical protein n=1 Tax=Acetobacter sp. TaxID=440 RepID=UPI0039E9372E
MSAIRTRKAWRCAVRGYDHESTVYAHTAGKARYSTYLDVSDGNDDVSFADIQVRRDRGADIILPAPLSVAGTVSQDALRALLHACGATRERPEKCGYRSHFYCSVSNPHMIELVAAGLMEGPKKGWEKSEGYFIATKLGHETALSLCPLYQGDDFAWPEVAA